MTEYQIESALLSIDCPCPKHEYFWVRTNPICARDYQMMYRLQKKWHDSISK
jgi:hypothetical protein